jgi:hypothetical protein
MLTVDRYPRRVPRPKRLEVDRPGNGLDHQRVEGELLGAACSGGLSLN